MYLFGKFPIGAGDIRRPLLVDERFNRLLNLSAACMLEDNSYKKQIHPVAHVFPYYIFDFKHR